MNLEGNLANEQEDTEQNNLEKETGWTKLENYTFDEDNFYRIVDEKGFEDFLETGLVRSSPTGDEPIISEDINIGGRPTAFPSFSKGAPDLSYTKKGSDNYIFESEIPMYKRGDIHPTIGFPIRGRHWAYRAIDQETGQVLNEMPANMIKNIYKIDTQGSLYIKS